ncbi:hypothetical protein E2C01_053977 [Portunus trituberculatus]|uniref:Uncharacterized protein n=1 Tax=Portunus trituberculatus TaxID=210409 RepID=A0A5B7GTQ1_PORTR|nr:hypothetical protein [Portunus trituberculatus]
MNPAGRCVGRAASCGEEEEEEQEEEEEVLVMVVVVVEKKRETGEVAGAAGRREGQLSRADTRCRAGCSTGHDKRIRRQPCQPLSDQARE